MQPPGVGSYLERVERDESRLLPLDLDDELRITTA